MHVLEPCPLNEVSVFFLHEGMIRAQSTAACGASRARTAAQRRTALTHTRTCAASLKNKESSRGLTASPLRSSLLCSFRPHLQYLDMTSLQNLLFNLAVESLPWPLASAMRQNGLLNPAVLKHYPLKSAEELGLATPQGTQGQDSASGSRRARIQDDASAGDDVAGTFHELVQWLLDVVGRFAGVRQISSLSYPFRAC